MYIRFDVLLLFINVITINVYCITIGKIDKQNVLFNQKNAIYLNTYTKNNLY